MRISGSFLPITSTVTKAIHDRNWTNFWETHFIPKWLPLFLGLGLGSLLALLIVNGAWTFLFALLLLVPLAILFNAYPFAIVIIWLLVMPFFQTTPTAASRYVYWMLHRAMIPAGLGIVVLSRLLRAKTYQPVRLGRAELAVGIFMGWVPVSIFLFQPEVTVSLILFYDRVLVSYCMYLLVRLTTPREKDMKRLLVAALVMAVSQSVIGLLSWFAPEVLPPQWLGFQGSRTTGTLRQPGPYTVVLVFSIALLFQAAMNRKPGLLRSVFLSAFGLGAVCVFLSLSRGSWLGGLFAAAGLLVLFPKSMIRMALVLLVIVAVLRGGVLSSQIAAASERMEQENSVDSRIGIAHAMLTMIKLKPFFGWGYDNQQRYSGQFIRRTEDIPIVSTELSSHNTFLTIAAELGLVGFFFYTFPFAWWLILTIRVLPRMPEKGLWSRSLLIVLWLIIVNYVVVGNFMDLRYFPFALTLGCMTLGLIANLVFPYLDPDDTEAPRWARQATRLA
jgi:O-antigen ligase